MHEVVGRGSREYMQLNGTVNLNDTPQHVKDNYNVYRVELNRNSLSHITPIPAKAHTELYLYGELTGNILEYNTPTYRSPQVEQQVMKYTSTEPIALPDTLPMVHWIQATGFHGDRLAVKLKLKRLDTAQNIYSDSIGNLYIYTVDKVYVYLKQQ